MRLSVHALLGLAALLGSSALACKGAGKAGSDGGEPAATATAGASASGRAADLPTVDAGVSAIVALGNATKEKEVLHPRTPASAGQKAEVPAGSYASGSTPGDDGREPAIEPLLVPVKLGAFKIDALPQPNDPATPPRHVGSREEAAEICKAQSGRLCTELEWEHACKGKDDDAYATGNAWDRACIDKPETCVSGFGARAMGARLEWTASTFPATGSEAFRGALEDDLVPGTRGCARRKKATNKERANATVRCCYGDPNAAEIAPIESKPAFRKPKLEGAELVKVLNTFPAFARLEGVRGSVEGEVTDVQKRSGAGHDGITFAWQPVLWSPETGVEVVVATGHSKATSFIVALYPLPNDTYRLASFFMFLSDLSSVVLAYRPDNRKELLWSSCWGCAGEQGAVSVRDDHHLVIVQH